MRYTLEIIIYETDWRDHFPNKHTDHERSLHQMAVEMKLVAVPIQYWLNFRETATLQKRCIYLNQKESSEGRHVPAAKQRKVIGG